MSEEENRKKIPEEVTPRTTTAQTSNRILHTSTPLVNTNKRRIMDFSLVNFDGNNLQMLSGDSGYISNNTESFSAHEPQSSMKQDEMLYVKSPYISEDALLEKPESAKKSKDNQDVYQEFAQLSYLNSVANDEATIGNRSILVPESDNEEEHISPVIDLQPKIFIGIDPYDNHSSNKENINFADINLQKIKITPRKSSRKTPRKRKRSTSVTPAKPYANPVTSFASPDLFSDEEPANTSVSSVNTSLSEKYTNDGDYVLRKKINKTLSGVPPPHCLTISNVTVTDMLNKLKDSQNSIFYWEKCSNSEGTGNKMNVVENSSKYWPEILNERQFGLSYNHSKVAEDLESLFMKYSQRYVGAETQSSCTIFDVGLSSPLKRKATRLRWATKSPGRRLSHLARRRITFSSANLQAGSSRQIMVDSRHLALLSRRVSPRKRKTPKKTPRKSSPRKQIRTPQSSAKKRLAFQVLCDENAKPSTSRAISATKRALFKSPAKSASKSDCSASPRKKMTPKRALFTSPAHKRRRLDIAESNEKKSMTTKECREFKSFPNNSTTSSLLTSQVIELSAQHKKKLQWAVYEALRGQNVGVNHENFRQYASVLARVTRRLLPTVSSVNLGTSERMLRVAKQHVFAACKGKTVEEIIRNFENARNSKVVKPIGYVAKENADRGSVDKPEVLATEKKVVPENKIDRVKKIIKF